MNISRVGRDFTWLGIAVLAGVVLLWFLLGLLPWMYSRGPEAAGQFGDSFGFVNALFSGLALAGVMLAVYLQTRELELQRKELVDTRKELGRSADAQHRAQDALQSQVEAMSIAARLNALSILIHSLDREIELANPLVGSGGLLKRRREYIAAVQRLLEREMPDASAVVE